MATKNAVILAAKAHTRIKDYADYIGIPVDQALSKVVEQWMDETGDLVIEEMERRAARPKLAIV